MFTKVDERVWSDTAYTNLSDDGKLLFLYVLSCSHRNMIGLYPLPIPYGAFDLGWEIERFSKGLDELSKQGFIKYNKTNHIVFIKNFLKYNPLENPNQVKGAIKALDTIPTNSIDIELMAYLRTVDKPFIQPLIELLDERLCKQEDVYEEEDVKVDEEETTTTTITKYKDIYDYYLTLDLIKHRAYTNDIAKAIKKGITDNKYSIDYAKTLLDRHKQVVDITKKKDYPVRARGLPEFFGQKAYEATHLICSEYEEGGKLYEEYLKGKKETKERPPLTMVYRAEI